MNAGRGGRDRAGGAKSLGHGGRDRPGGATNLRHGATAARPGAAGFTLIEVLVAVVILAVALAATSRAASLATDSALETRHRLLATWAAENRVAELRARRLFPPPATTRLTAEQAGLALVIDEVVAETPNPLLRRVELAVADARDPGRVLTRMTAYVSQ
jgi:general secretion pathway protein I